MYVIVNIIITIIAILFLSLELFIANDEIGSINSFNITFLLILNFIPSVILLVIGLIAKKFNWNKIVNICINIILVILSLFYFIFIGLGMTVAMLFWDTTPREPKIENYQSELYKIKTQYKIPAFNHFPKTLPEDIEDYYFFIENSFDGEDTHYLKFRANSAYINNELSQKCNNKIITKEQLDKKNIIACNSPIYEETALYCLIHTNEDSGRYITGIATDNERNLIKYFVKFY